MSGNAIKIAPLLPKTQPMVTTQMMPISLGNLKLSSVTPTTVTYNPVSNPISLVLRPSLSPLTIGHTSNNPPPLIITTPVQNNLGINKNGGNPGEQRTEIVYKFINPEDLNLRYVKRGRKKGKVQDTPVEVKDEPPPPPVKASRTRSGRIVKMPKHIEKDFEKIVSTNSATAGFKTEKFAQVEEAGDPKKKLAALEKHSRKRTVRARYRCSICNKAYLNKKAAYYHLLKNPDHGPLPDENNNFEVWNYLVDITQKKPSGQRGVKFCEELTNLLHNLQLLTGALFKTENIAKNNASQKTVVQIDKILGNAMALEPGKYYFDENELYKDVTVLKLITHSQFFAPKKAPPDVEANVEKHCVTDTKDAASIGNIKIINSAGDCMSNQPKVKILSETVLNRSTTETLTSVNKTEEEKVTLMETDVIMEAKETEITEMIVPKFDTHIGNGSSGTSFSENLPARNFSDNFEAKTVGNVKTDSITNISHQNCLNTINNQLINANFQDSSMVSDHSKTISFPPHLLASQSFEPKCIPDLKPVDGLKLQDSACVEGFSKVIDDQIMDTTYKKLDASLSIHSDLLSDNSLLALPNLRTSDDEMMLTNVDAGSNLLDNSTSSDEVMNVDQFVNERFKKITEPDTDLKFNTSLNLDLPSLDLFEFHTS